MLSRVAALFAVSVVLLGVAASATAEDQTVSALSSDTFSPADVTVTQGEQVTFQNSGGLHNVHFDGESAANPTSPSTSGWKFNRTFNQVGDFRFYCDQHGGPGGIGMSGTVHVVAPQPGSPPPGGGPPTPGPGPGGSPAPGPGGPAPGGQPGDGGAKLKVTLKASDTTPRAGKRVRLFGVVTPARDGAKLLIQKRVKGGKFKTIATTRLHAAAGDKSTYSLRLKLSKDVVLRAKVGSAASKVRKLDVRAHPSAASA